MGADQPAPPALSRSGVVYLVTSVAALGFMHSLVRQIYAATDYAFTALQVSLWRFTLSAVALWVFTILAFRGSPSFASEARRLVRPAVILGFFYSFASIAMFSATRYIPVPVFVVLFYTYPLVAVLLARLLGERLPRVFWISLFLALGGVILTAATELAGVEAMGADAPLGIAFALAAAALIASYIVSSQRILRGRGSDMQTVAIGVSWISSSGALTLIAMALVSGQGLGLDLARDIWWLLLALGALVTFAVFALNMGIQRLGGPRAALVANVELIFTMFFAWVWLGEWLAPLQFLGGALILASLVLFARGQLRPQRRAQDPARANP